MLDKHENLCYNKYRKLRKEVNTMFKRLFTKREKEISKTYKVKYDDSGDIVEDTITSSEFSNYMMGLDMVGAVVLSIEEM